MKLINIFILFLLCSFGHQQVQAIAYRVSVLGTGYVGLVLGACLADFGHKVICADIDEHKIKSLKKGHIPIYEPGLKEMVDQGVANNTLTFTSNINHAIKDSQVIFIAVGTPMDEDGQADLTSVKAVAKTIGKNLNGEYKLICTKSTVPIGTGKIIKNIIKEVAPRAEFEVSSNPEFLREGSAILDFLKPDRVVIGVESNKSQEILQNIYRPLLNQNVPLVVTDITTAETIKYAANSFLAAKISFINEIANLCEATGADVLKVAYGMGLDKRIGQQFLNPGPGFGGSCFPKDTQALLYIGKTFGAPLKVVEAALQANEAQKMRIFNKLSHLLDNNLKDKTIALLGLAFKADTDDIRYSAAIPLIEQSLSKGANIKAYDPAASDNMKKVFKNITYCSSYCEAVKDADIVVVLTEWTEFKKINLQEIRSLVKQPILLDARNIIDTRKLKELGFKFDNIGNAQVSNQLRNRVLLEVI